MAQEDTFQSALTPFTPARAALTAFWVLCFMWLKFATIWRFMRCGILLLQWTGVACDIPTLARPEGFHLP
jgi:hypothetical protein